MELTSSGPVFFLAKNLVTASLSQKVNGLAVSGLAFVLVAIYVFQARKLGKKNNWVFGSALLVAGLGTFFFHSTLSFFWQTIDNIGMYLFVTFIVFYGRKRDFLKEYVILNIVLALALVFLSETRRYLFAALILLAVISEAASKEKPDKVLFWTAVVVLAAGFIFWTLDQTGILCSPDSVFQGHSFWHLAGALAALLTYEHYTQNP